MKLFAFMKREKGETARLYRVETNQRLTREQLLTRMSLLSQKRRRLESSEIETEKNGRRGPRARSKQSDDPPSRLPSATESSFRWASL